MCPRTAGTLPTSLSWKAAVSAPKSRVCVLLPCSSSWFYHVWVGKVSGGVDVFLFISAFLLSLSFMRKINEGKPLNLLNYWTHVFTRLLPAASVVILLILAVGWNPQDRNAQS